MWPWLVHNGSHALAPVFRFQPEHSAKECDHCAQRQRNQVQHIAGHVPLEYQKSALSQTVISRFSVVVNRVKTHESSAHGKSFQDVWRNEFQCRINRVLDVHQPATIPPSADNVRSELETLAASLKIGDRVLMYWHDGAESQTSVPSSLLPLPWSVLGARRPDIYAFVWVVTTQPVSETDGLLTYRYGSNGSGSSAVVPTNEPRGKLRLYVLAPTTFESAPTFSALWLNVMQRYRYRLSVVRLLEELQGQAVLWTNFPLNARTAHFGFA